MTFKYILKIIQKQKTRKSIKTHFLKLDEKPRNSKKKVPWLKNKCPEQQFMISELYALYSSVGAQCPRIASLTL